MIYPYSCKRELFGLRNNGYQGKILYCLSFRVQNFSPLRLSMGKASISNKKNPPKIYYKYFKSLVTYFWSLGALFWRSWKRLMTLFFSNLCYQVMSYFFDHISYFKTKSLCLDQCGYFCFFPAICNWQSTFRDTVKYKGQTRYWHDLKELLLLYMSRDMADTHLIKLEIEIWKSQKKI